MGTLAAVAIPAYNRYRTNAARGAFDATRSNIHRAFQSCVAVNPFTSCDNLGEINMPCTICGTPVAKQPLFCVDMTQEIGGTEYWGCVSSNSGTGGRGNSLNVNQCYADGGTIIVSGFTCTTGNDYSTQSGCETASSPIVECTTDQNCIDVGSNYCIGGSTGKCDTTAATCL